MLHGVGYVVGCFISILLWKLDRTKIIYIINNFLKKIIKFKVLIQIFYLVVVLILVSILGSLHNNELYNFITAFIIIDVSNTERKNLNLKEKAHFYDSMSIISRSLLCGFIAPLFIILLLGNNFAIAYMIIYNLYCVDNYPAIKFIFIILSLIPAFFTHLLLYVIYLVRNKKTAINFKGDYLANCFTRPLLNLDIFGAYIESVNFYYHFNEEDMYYIKSYGEYSNKIDEVCIKDYLSVSYGICMVIFLIFFLALRLL
jgi:hypothetical protein